MRWALGVVLGLVVGAGLPLVAQPRQEALGRLQEELVRLVGEAGQAVVTVFTPTGLGSGFLLDREGHLATNWHVVEGAVRAGGEVRVLVQGRPLQYRARVVGGSPVYDLAVVRLLERPDQLPSFLPLGNSDGLRRGEVVVALGSPYGLEGSVTWGIVSALRPTVDVVGRPIYRNDWLPEVVQIQAPIYPGNSGGPLVNLRGEVVGVNTYLRGQTETGLVPFAVPVNYLRRHLEEFLRGVVLDEEALRRRVPRIGAEVVPLNLYPGEVREEYNLPDYGLMVQAVAEGSPAARAGLRPATRFVELREGVRVGGVEVRRLGVNGEVIVAVDGQPVFSVPQLRGMLLKGEGRPVRLTLLQRGSLFETTLTPVVGR